MKLRRVRYMQLDDEGREIGWSEWMEMMLDDHQVVGLAFVYPQGYQCVLA